MFVTVRYGDEQEKIFNPDCRNDILLHFIKLTCQCHAEDIVELSDERGTVKNLRQNPTEYASDYLRDRETLVLLKVDSSNQQQTTPEEPVTSPKVVYTPLLSSLMTNADFIEVLNPPKDDDSLSDTLSIKSTRRRSSTFEIDEMKNGKSKGKGGTTAPARKTNSRRGQRPPLRKSANSS